MLGRGEREEKGGKGGKKGERNILYFPVFLTPPLPTDYGLRTTD